jgi:HD-GYP domain-containing protein (c-di-GMP phosphodiesterase class II)
MDPLTISFVDSAPFRLFTQVFTFILVALATRMVWKEYQRNRSAFLKYISLSFLSLLLQHIFLLSTFTWSFATGNGLPEAIMPMIDHLFKVGGIILFVHAFIAAGPLLRGFRRTFHAINFTLLAFTAPFFWYSWLRYLGHAVAGQQKFAYHWVDMAYETWATVLLIVGLYVARRSNVAMKREFVGALALLLAREILHIWNIIVSANTVSAIVVVERLLLVPFFVVIIEAIHREIIGEIERVNRAKEAIHVRMYESTIQALVGSLELKDSYTQGHAERVTAYALEIGRRLALDDDELHDLYLGAILHDVGKIGIHEDILAKPEALTDAERREISRHPVAGAGIVEKIDTLRHLRQTVLSHHERWDGSGYPQGLNGEDIPLHARIVAVADAFDAMTSCRPYRQGAFDHDAALRELELCRNTQFDPRVVEAFRDYLCGPGGIEVAGQAGEPWPS